jgi:hypothetical protein
VGDRPQGGGTWLNRTAGARAVYAVGNPQPGTRQSPLHAKKPRRHAAGLGRIPKPRQSLAHHGQIEAAAGAFLLCLCPQKK